MKNDMKRFVALLISALMMISVVSMAFADEGKVEISFKVGDSILKINGVETEVEKPYIAGEGTTLVPLRVITEAFGAEVGWDGDTQTVMLSYPGVNISLQINNIVAKVNDHAETLLQPPVLSGSGVTMVPLRFISETFGADVGYDSADGAILVTKGGIDNSQTVTGITDKARTGDSYYKWSIDTPTQMQMTDRYHDGRSTEFKAEDGSLLYVDIFKDLEEDYITFDERYTKVQSSFSGYTLMEAEKLTDEAGHQYMHFRAKDKENTIDYCEYYAEDKTRYIVAAVITNSNETEIKNMLLALSASFKLGEIDEGTYDLSNVVNGMRTVKDDTYKVSFKIPADLEEFPNENAGNEFDFIKYDGKSYTGASLSIYSKTGEVTAESMANKDRSTREKNCNPDLSYFSVVEKVSEGRFRYIHIVSGTTSDDSYCIDEFIERGDYVYNISATVEPDKKALAEEIVSSLKIEMLDSSEIGKLLRNDPDADVLVTKKLGSHYTFKIPSTWETPNITGTSNAAVCINTYTKSMITAMAETDKSYTKGSLRSVAGALSSQIEAEEQNKIVNRLTYDSVGGKEYAHFTYSMIDDKDEQSYVTVYMSTDNGELIMFTLYERELYYHKTGNEEFLRAIESLTK